MDNQEEESMSEAGSNQPDPPQYEFSPLKYETQEMRFLILKPHIGEVEDDLECELAIQPLAACEPYTYIANTRGSTLVNGQIFIGGLKKYVTVNIMFFLRLIRRKDVSLRLWFRDVCINHTEPEEYSRYWTPDWMETMRSHASNVIDLSEVMATEFDKGNLWRPFAPSRRRPLGDMPEPKLPRHHPIPIGSWKGPDAPPSLHQYLPLDYTMDEIRLVALWCAEDKSAQLVANFAYNPMYEGSTYHGLSYTWGQDNATDEILLNGQLFMIRKNLADGLRAIRSKDSKIVLWIDAICIQQDDIAEKNRQIPRMLEIYEDAVVVISWVGEHDDASRTAFELIKEGDVKSIKLQRNDNGKWNVKDPDSLPRRFAALYRFLLRPYFQRLWVIQELAASRVPAVQCGDDMLGWSDIDSAARNLIDIIHADSTMAPQMIEADPLLHEVSQLQLSFIRRLTYFRHLRTHDLDPFPFNSSWLNIKDDSPGILDCVVMARDFQSSVPHDKIFGVWNLAQDIKGINFKPDYSKSLSQTYLDFAIAVASHSASLDIICSSEPLMSDEPDMPSWCPDWGVSSTCSSFARQEHVPNIIISATRDESGSKFHAAGPQDLMPHFSFDGKTLECAGIIQDSIRLLSPYESDVSDDTQRHVMFLAWLNTAAVECNSKYPDVNVLLSTFWSMLVGDTTGVWGPKDIEGKEGAFTIECLKQTEARYQNHWGPTYTRHILTRGRRFFVSAQGYMGLAPWYAEEGQELAILGNCSVPVVLEKNDDGNTYRFIGSCFVQGWMDGEILGMYGDTAEEAWEKLNARGRLQIV